MPKLARQLLAGLKCGRKKIEHHSGSMPLLGGGVGVSGLATKPLDDKTAVNSWRTGPEKTPALHLRKAALHSGSGSGAPHPQGVWRPCSCSCTTLDKVNRIAPSELNCFLCPCPPCSSSWPLLFDTYRRLALLKT